MATAPLSQVYASSDFFKEVISDSNIPWCELKNSAVLITGATGAVGLALVRTLFAANKMHNLGIKILAFGKSEKKVKSLIEKYGVVFHKHDVREPFTLNENVDYIFHCAAITKSSDMVNKPVDVMYTAVDGTRNMLELAKEKRIKSAVYLSSMEVYGQYEGEAAEKDLGRLDLTNARSCYPESKRFCEMLCNSYHVQYGIPVKTARLAQTFGAGTAKDDTRVYAQFAKSAAAAEDIILHTEGKSRGNYCDISDTVRALFTLLLKGENGQAYNIANPKASMTIREMAEFAAAEFGVKVRVEAPKNAQKLGYAPDSSYKLNIDKITNLGWNPKYGLIDMYRHMTADWLKN
ncbi:MAG: NAD(P)-dependent oxidoreductase [Treponema sp.]|nr:NAD(P)-dependent oxidoreductase [Treponema sp.]